MKRALVLCPFLFLVAAAPSWAHEVRPGYLELRETAPDRCQVLWKQPARGETALRLAPAFSDPCKVVSVGDPEILPGALLTRMTLSCPGGLAGKTIRIAGLEATLTDVLVRARLLNGAEETHLLRPNAPWVTLGTSSGGAEGALVYMRLGIQHILLGVDHLLFVLGLLLIVGNRWMVLKTISSFTVAHSITLAIATLGYASAPLRPLNAAIALSILFLGPEIVRTWRGETSVTIRRPWLVAFAFGLLHGFGFASGLTSMGLANGEIPLALVLFNVGVEIGQLVFVFLVLAMAWSYRQLEIVWPRWALALPGYMVGSLGAFWTVQRTAILLGFVR